MATYKSEFPGAKIDEAVRMVLNGEVGSATVTADSIKNALGYTPADKTVTDTLTTKVSNLETKVDNISGGTAASDVPAYVVTEAERVVAAINAARTSQSLVLLCASDVHTLTGNAQSKETTLHLAQGINEICKRVTVDGVAILGDSASGAYTVQDCKDEIDYLRVNLGDTQGVPQIWMQGNHDHNSKNSNKEYLTADELYAHIGANTTDKAVTDYANLHRMYGYVDYDRQRIRALYLNTSDITDTYSSDYGVTTVQLQWLVNTLADVQSGWGVVVMSHHPLNTDTGASTSILTILDEYKGKQSGSVSSVSYDFTSAQGELICHLHGHIHNYQAKTYGTNVVLSITIPNGCFGRNNEYGTAYGDVVASAWGDADESGEQRVITKTSGTAEDTAYTAVVIDRKNGVVHALRCGAGIDRTLVYAGDTMLYSVSAYMLNISSSNTATSVVSGASYTTTLTANTGYTLGTVQVLMGGTDITATAYADGKITIAKVTGDINIVAEAVESGSDAPAGDYTNLVPTAQAVDSTAVYNGTGYKDGYRLASSDPYESEATGYVATGLIPYSVPTEGVPGTIYIYGADWNEVSDCRMRFFNASKQILTPYINGGGTDTGALGSYYTVETLGSKYYKLTPIANPDSSSGSWIGPVLVAQITNAAFFRFSLAGSGSGLVITVDEPIE